MRGGGRRRRAARVRPEFGSGYSETMRKRFAKNGRRLARAARRAAAGEAAREMTASLRKEGKLRVPLEDASFVDPLLYLHVKKRAKHAKRKFQHPTGALVKRR